MTPRAFFIFLPTFFTAALAGLKLAGVLAAGCWWVCLPFEIAAVIYIVLLLLSIWLVTTGRIPAGEI
jgi:hypothetical protein